MHTHLHNMKIQKCEFKFAVTLRFPFHFDLEHGKNHRPSFIRRYQSTSSQCSISTPLLKSTDVFMGYRIEHIHTYTHNNFAILKFSLTQGLKLLHG